MKLFLTSVSEHLLGKRIVNYLKNEALVGRINSKKLQVRALVLDIWTFNFVKRTRTRQENSHIIYVVNNQKQKV